MKKKLLVLAIIFFAGFVHNASAQNKDDNSEFEKFKKAQKEGIRQQEESFQQYKAEVTKQFADYTAEQERLFKEYVGQIEKKWGKKLAETSTKKEYVAYDAAYSSRNKINFETGVAKVEVLVSEADAKNQKLVQEKLKEQIEKIITTKGGDDPLEVKTNITPEPKPLVADQIQTKDGKPVTESSAKQFADQAVQSFSVTQEVVTGSDGVKRVVLGVQLPLVPDHVKKRAIEFKEQVQLQAAKFGIDATLVFAVMHTESYFNPMARSAVPAYGLMQLVPQSGARDAYLFVFHRDTLVTGEYLYIAGKNIELGAGYLAKLLAVDFKDIKDPKSRIYCAISAYNTGPGNVAKTFVGKRNVALAVPKINAMTSAEVFDFLKKNLPYDETRQYVAKVSDRMGIYNEWSVKN